MTRARTPRRIHPLRAFLILHAKLLLCLTAGGIAVLLTPSDWQMATRLLTGWDIAAAIYLTVVSVLVAPDTIDEIKKRAAVQDDGAGAVLLLTMLASFASLAALVVLLGGKSEGSQAGWQMAFAMGTIVLSWLFMHTAFTLHYAHEYYGERGDARVGGLKFPGQENPDYLDFFYFSMVIAMTSQVSDVAITSKAIRRVATLHGILSFFFNLGIIALTINMIAGAVSGT